jgi:hypothetical protein
MPDLKKHVSSSLVLRRGPYIVGAGVDETDVVGRIVRGKFVDLFDPALAVQSEVKFADGAKHFLVDLERYNKPIIAAAGELKVLSSSSTKWEATMEGIAGTDAVILMKARAAPTSITVDGKDLAPQQYDAQHHLLWIRFPNSSDPQKVEVKY